MEDNDNILKYSIIEFKGKDIYAYRTPIAKSRKDFLLYIRNIYKFLNI